MQLIASPGRRPLDDVGLPQWPIAGRTLSESRVKLCVTIAGAANGNRPHCGRPEFYFADMSGRPKIGLAIDIVLARG
jgi:hypothetical protein